MQTKLKCAKIQDIKNELHVQVYSQQKCQLHLLFAALQYVIIKCTLGIKINCICNCKVGEGWVGRSSHPVHVSSSFLFIIIV